MLLLNKFCDIISGVDDNVYSGGSGVKRWDFNCAAKASVDRNHLEPHPASSALLKRLIENHDLKEYVGGFDGRTRQFTWSHCRDYTRSLARLNRFHCFKHPLSVFKSCQIIPVGLSNHSLVHCAVFIQNIKTSSAYCLFNSALRYRTYWTVLEIKGILKPLKVKRGL